MKTIKDHCMGEIPKEMQIAVLKRVRAKLIKESEKYKNRDVQVLMHPLCLLIKDELCWEYAKNTYYIIMDEVIPLFNFANAKKHANATQDISDCWWDTNPYDFKNRILFLDWIIKTMENE
jgi:hypothetical protein